MNTIPGREAIRTHAGVTDARRSRTPQGALLEMASLEMERQRLLAESVRLQRRSEQIAHRVAEIGRRQQHLQRFINPGPPTAKMNSGVTGETTMAFSPVPTTRTAPSRHSRKLGY